MLFFNLVYFFVFGGLFKRLILSVKFGLWEVTILVTFGAGENGVPRPLCLRVYWHLKALSRTNGFNQR